LCSLNGALPMTDNVPTLSLTATMAQAKSRLSSPDMPITMREKPTPRR
jgi:hypothetical protein